MLIEDASEDYVDPNSLMTHGEYHILNKKLDTLLCCTRTCSTINFENMVTTYQSIMKDLTSTNVKTFQDQKELIKEANTKVDLVKTKVDLVIIVVKDLSEKVNYVLNDFQEK